MSDSRTRLQQVLQALGLDLRPHEGTDRSIRAPRDGVVLAGLRWHTPEQAQAAIEDAHRACLDWRDVPAPVRGELVRRLGETLRRHKAALGALVSLEAGKITAEGLGEVQEMIDICDFAVGLSRQLHGLTIASERTGHRMMETWHPMGVVGIITAFNFPVAVWSWNAALALVCGNAIVWKPSEKTPLTAIACQHLLLQTMAAFNADRPGTVREGLSQLFIGGRELGEALAASPQVAVLSATGSTRMGRQVAVRVAERFGRAILELGGNNAMIVTPTADLELAARAITFAAVGTAGQRCTTLRRLIVHASVADALLARLTQIYQGIAIGDPLAQGTLVGPLIDRAAFEAMQQALAQARAEGGQVLGGERVRADLGADAFYVRPALVQMPRQSALVEQETFAPILYVLRYGGDIDAAIALQNAVPQGLSSAIFTQSLFDAERFMSVAGSDCGIANVNIGTSGAEIGGAFGG
ncbi:MAG TPA: aldehyde dehydrogenase family protein, partial [Alicycliphilus sp.]|nr:aldehyde dehydrogenase family protein [Alicycliphilus sp.]